MSIIAKLEELRRNAGQVRTHGLPDATIERMAAQDLRSVNAEVECLLREALAKRGVKVAPSEGPRRGRPPKEKQ